MPQLDTSFYISQLFWLTIFFSLTYWYIANFYLPSMVYMYKFNRKKLAKINNEITEIKSGKGSIDQLYVTTSVSYIVEVIDSLNESNKKTGEWFIKSLNELNKTSLNSIDQKYIDTVVSLDYMYNQWKLDNKQYWSSL